LQDGVSFTFTHFYQLAKVLIIIHLSYGQTPNQEEFWRIVKKWEEKKGALAGMLVKPSLHQPPPEFQESDIYDYGVERIIIVERPILVDLLPKSCNEVTK
jgi:hypothetical protein